jgi:glucosamine--fructose-6-phosphate aminotransferase (isomerizing)
VGREKAKPILMEGLKRLEYRGYDSAGLAIQSKKHIDYYRTVGKIIELERKTNDLDIPGTSGIAHTRWATHGEPTEENAHPHRDEKDNIYVIHNGIIENFHHLKKKLEKSGVHFRSETDTEVLAHLIARNFDLWIGRHQQKNTG